MTTEWWNTGSPETDTPTQEPYRALPPAPAPERLDPPPSLDPPKADPPKADPPEPERESGAPAPGSSARGTAVKVVGIAGAAIAALLVGQSIFGGGDGGHEGHSASTPTKQSGDLPAAGGGPKGVAPADGSPDAQQGRASQSAAPKTVTLHMTPSGKGRVGAIVTVEIHNGTDDPLTVMATTIKGDGRSAIVGEGTLAPGSRVVQPGEDSVGTVEFSSSKAPQQIALVDLSGNVIAAS